MNACSDIPFESSDKRLRAYVLAHVAECPGAMDTLRGIADWWITRQQIRVEVERLERVLEELTREGVLEGVGLGDARVYRLRTSPALRFTGGPGG